MKAVLCKAFGPPESLVVEEIDPPAPGAGEVSIDVHAAGVNFPDLLIVQGLYQLKPGFPFSPGSEVAGTVRALGDGVTGLKVGARVLATMLWGAFREVAVADARSVFPIPDSMSFQTAAGFALTYGTSIHALKDRATLKAGETLLVLGAAGGVGLAAVELGKAMGARVIAAASTPQKLEVCRAHGADEGVCYGTEDLKARVKDLTGGDGANVIYDPVGGELAEAALRSIAWEGRYLVVGFAAGDIPRIPLNLVLLKGCQIVGVFWGSFVMREPAQHRANVASLVEMFTAQKLRPRIDKTYPLDDAARALDDLAQRRVRGKVVLVPGGRA